MGKSKLAFVAVFFALSILPVLQWATGLVDVSVLQEKRRLAPPPDVAKIVLHGDGRLSAAINTWFDDHYGFRPLFVRLKHQLDYWMFRYSDKIFIGRQGWLYQPGFFDAEIAGERAGDAGADIAHQRYLELAQYLAQAGVRLIIVNNPDKETVYPQFMPNDIPSLPRNSRYQQMRAWLKLRSEFEYIDGEDVLAHCQGERSFNLIDIHMTLPGGVCFAKAVIAQIAKDEGRSASPWDHSFSYTTVRSSGGGQADFLALLLPVHQDAFVPNRTYENDPGFARDPAGIFDWTYHAHTPDGAGLLPPVVFYGDSFLDHYPSAGVQTYLAAAYRTRDNAGSLQAALEHLPSGTRYFVLEFVEPWFDRIMQDKIPKH
jgi:hypothetical protein